MRGKVIGFVEADGLGDIELEDGRCVRFGTTACKDFGRMKPSAGLSVHVESVVPGFAGKLKATKVTLAQAGTEPAREVGAPPFDIVHPSFSFVTAFASEGAPILVGDAIRAMTWRGLEARGGAARGKRRPARIIEVTVGDGAPERHEFADVASAERFEKEAIARLEAAHPHSARVGREPWYFDDSGRVAFRVRAESATEPRGTAPTQFDKMVAKLRGGAKTIAWDPSSKATFVDTFGGGTGFLGVALDRRSFVLAIGDPGDPMSFLTALGAMRLKPAKGDALVLGPGALAFDAGYAAQAVAVRNGASTFEALLQKIDSIPLVMPGEADRCIAAFRIAPGTYSFASGDVDIDGATARVVTFSRSRNAA